MLSELTTPVETPVLTSEVDGMLDAAEPEGVFRDTRECGGGLLLAGLLLISPPTPRPKAPQTDAR